MDWWSNFITDMLDYTHPNLKFPFLMGFKVGMSIYLIFIK